MKNKFSISLVKILWWKKKTTCLLWSSKCKFPMLNHQGTRTYFLLQPSASLLCSCFLGCHATLPRRNGCSHPNNIPFLLCLWWFAVCLCSVEQTNHIIAKCEWRKISRKKACSENTQGISGFCFTPHVAKNRRHSQATIMKDEKKR